ncbi:MAG: glycosyltransferase family 9 protein [Chloracidobacterium sp.]|nr:glycosyltransferase family 9 protein [Chloracidobacterium sp.]
MVNADKIDWSLVKRVLVVKLRSIGDTVLATPSLIALKRFLPDAQIDILLEDWVAPVLDGFDAVENVLTIGKSTSDRIKTALDLRRRKYDVAFNLHGGTTATMLVRATGARHRVGAASYQYPYLYNHLLPSAAEFWDQETTHSAEQQLAMIGFVGVPVEDRPKTRLIVTVAALESVIKKLSDSVGSVHSVVTSEKNQTTENTEDTEPKPIAIIHPSTAFATKQWPTENFARTAEFLNEKGLNVIAIASKNENNVLGELQRESNVPITTFDDLTLPEITALASKARVFVGNDSGIAHIAAAVGTPSVVVFGSSNRNHWRPWTDAPNEIVFEPLPCQPCPGYTCEVFGEPKCILSVTPSAVFTALERVLS